MKTLMFFLIFTVAAFSQSFQRQNLSSTYVNPNMKLDSLTTYHWDIHNYGPDSVQIMVKDSLYPIVSPSETVNYNFSLDSLLILPVWKAIPSSASVFYRVYK